MNQEILLDNRVEREKLMGRLDVLGKVKELILLPYEETMTREMVADYYGVGIEAIGSLIKDNRDEIDTDGYKVLTGDELKSFKNLCQFQSRTRNIAIFPRRAILRVGMLLRDSVVAKEIRNRLLDMSENGEIINKTVEDISDEQLLFIDIVKATNDVDRMIAVSKLNTYKEEKIIKIKEELNYTKQTSMELEYRNKLSITYNICYPILDKLQIKNNLLRYDVHKTIKGVLLNGKYENINKKDGFDANDFEKRYRAMAIEYKENHADKFL